MDGPKVGPWRWSNAIAINMHHFGLGMFSDLWRLSDAAHRSFLQSIACDHLIWGFPGSDPRMRTEVGFAGMNDTTRRAEKMRFWRAMLCNAQKNLKRQLHRSCKVKKTSRRRFTN
jgi:hypothetical protein